MEVAKWAKERGCPWDDVDLRAMRRGRRPPGDAAVGAGERRSVGRGTCADAASGGHLEVLQWARANGCPWDEETCREAAEGGHLEVLQWARANGAPWNEGTCRQCRVWRPPGGVAVGARERRSVGRGLAPTPRIEATWRCCSGRERTALRVTRRLAAMPRVAATWRCCSGRARTALRGFRRECKAEGRRHEDVVRWIAGEVGEGA